MLEPGGSDFRLVEALHARDYNVVETEIILWEEFFDFKKNAVPAPCVESFLLKDPPIHRACFRDRGQAYRSRVPGACKKGWEQFHRHRPGSFIDWKRQDDYLGKSGS